MDYKGRRERVFEQMENNSALILFSGVEVHTNADAYFDFEPNHNFFYLTGLRREHMILTMIKSGDKPRTVLFIEEANPHMVRWTGKRVSIDEAKEISSVDEVRYLDSFEPMIGRLLAGELAVAYCDTARNSWGDLPDYNCVKAREIAEKFPGVVVKNIFPVIAKLRMEKDADEIKEIQAAVDVTDKALQHMLSRLKPGMKEYQAQADYEYMVHYLGADGVSFPTIAGSGANGTMLHYETNRDTCEDGTLLLLDLGSRVNGYCSDITRTYPVNGKYSERQRKVYDIVLKANREVAKAAKPGLTMLDLQNICKKVLAEGCMELGLIKEETELDKYYMHGVSHHLGIDVHDVSVGASVPMTPGTVFTDEPGLYIDEWEIGVRIEDDILITEDGCVVLSENIMRDPDEIEAFMAANAK